MPRKTIRKSNAFPKHKKRMKHRLQIILVLAASQLAAERPNVVYILADDLGYGDFSCYGATHFDTPAADRLAEEGMRFTDAHSPSSVCSPSRYAALTGRYAWRSWLKNWVVQVNQPLLVETDRLTLGTMFQEAGYVTACVGKWHLGWGEDPGIDFSGELKPGPLEVGFDSFFGVPFSHNSPPPLEVFVRDRRIVGLEEGLSYRSEAAMAETRRSLEDTAINLSREAVAFIDRHKEEPFFLFYPTTNIHYPLTPNEKFQGQSEAGVYGDFVVEFDWVVAQVLEALDRNGLTENTIVVLTSDNGAKPAEGMNGHACNGPLRGTKRTSYEAGHRVPLILRWPGVIEPGSTRREAVSLTDLFATFADLLDHRYSEDAGEDSYNLMPLLKADENPPAEWDRPGIIHHSMAGQFSIRMGDWKLIEGSGDGDYPRDEEGKIDVVNWGLEENEQGERVMDYFELEPDGTYQLYNLREDPAETRNLAEAQPERVSQMLAVLNRMRDSGRSVPRP